MLSDNEIENLVDACTEVAGGAVRSIVYFTTSEYDQIYLRDYLSADADIRAFVENEREGFDRIVTHEGSELGRYEFTIRRFHEGYLVQVVSGEHGVFVTTNQLHIEQYDQLADAIEQALEGLA